MPSNKKDYIDLLKDFIDKSKEIDKKTEWQEFEPLWWLLMMSMQRMAIQHKSKLESES